MTLGSIGVLGMLFLKVGGRIPVLVVAQSVPAGQVLTAPDLQVVEIAPGTLTGIVPSEREATILGQPAAVPLVPGEVLTQSLIGVAQFPPTDQAVASMHLKSGSFPPDLTPGSHVQVVAPSASPTSPVQIVADTATVTKISTPDDQGSAVVSVLTDPTSAQHVGAAQTDTLALVLQPAGG
ncbi:hypothetical protein KGQ19_00580 [Catenulispora sp. NL8]|uniref:SAF domain-containing protein n=1 Tax=Catenulispora pinistramenti TaxID=2705254 RepID=A0ABS5KGN6_9ACTN|nr:SAF domain-containing protein [Catenulispora pinistramenti]MBS2545354.1 hypothetical protein [Catenulispora pinistramenti]